MTTMTDMMTRSLLGRAREVAGGPTLLSHAHAHAQAMVQAAASPASGAHASTFAPDASVTTTRTYATAVVTNPWLGGFGFGEGMGICPMTVVGDSTKRIQPGRLEGMT